MECVIIGCYTRRRATGGETVIGVTYRFQNIRWTGIRGDRENRIAKTSATARTRWGPAAAQSVACHPAMAQRRLRLPAPLQRPWCTAPNKSVTSYRRSVHKSSVANDVCRAGYLLGSWITRASQWQSLEGRVRRGYPLGLRVHRGGKTPVVTRGAQEGGGASDANATVTSLETDVPPRPPPCAQSGQGTGGTRGAKKQAAGSEPRDPLPGQPQNNNTTSAHLLAPELGSSILGSGTKGACEGRRTGRR